MNRVPQSLLILIMLLLATNCKPTAETNLKNAAFQDEIKDISGLQEGKAFRMSLATDTSKCFLPGKYNIYSAKSVSRLKAKLCGDLALWEVIAASNDGRKIQFRPSGQCLQKSDKFAEGNEKRIDYPDQLKLKLVECESQKAFIVQDDLEGKVTLFSGADESKKITFTDQAIFNKRFIKDRLGEYSISQGGIGENLSRIGKINIHKEDCIAKEKIQSDPYIMGIEFVIVQRNTPNSWSESESVWVGTRGHTVETLEVPKDAYIWSAEIKKYKAPDVYGCRQGQLTDFRLKYFTKAQQDKLDEFAFTFVQNNGSIPAAGIAGITANDYKTKFKDLKIIGGSPSIKAKWEELRAQFDSNDYEIFDSTPEKKDHPIYQYLTTQPIVGMIGSTNWFNTNIAGSEDYESSYDITSLGFYGLAAGQLDYTDDGDVLHSNLYRQDWPGLEKFDMKGWAATLHPHIPQIPQNIVFHSNSGYFTGFTADPSRSKNDVSSVSIGRPGEIGTEDSHSTCTIDPWADEVIIEVGYKTENVEMDPNRLTKKDDPKRLTGIYLRTSNGNGNENYRYCDVLVGKYKNWPSSDNNWSKKFIRPGYGISGFHGTYNDIGIYNFGVIYVKFDQYMKADDPDTSLLNETRILNLTALQEEDRKEHKYPNIHPGHQSICYKFYAEENFKGLITSGCDKTPTCNRVFQKHLKCYHALPDIEHEGREIKSFVVSAEGPNHPPLLMTLCNFKTAQGSPRCGVYDSLPRSDTDPRNYFKAKNMGEVYAPKSSVHFLKVPFFELYKAK